MLSIKSKTKTSAKGSKQVKLVRLVRSEERLYITYGANQSLVTSVSAIPAYINLCPSIANGGGQPGRIGNRINMTGGKLRLSMNLLPYNATTNPNAPPIYLRCLVVSSKSANTSNLGSTSVGSDLFMSTGTVVGPQNNVLDIVLPINRESWTVYHDSVRKLGVAGAGATGPASSTSWIDESSMSAFLDLGLPALGECTYNATSSNDCRNKNLFFIMLNAPVDGFTGSGTYTTAEYHFGLEVDYTDD